MKKKSKRTCSQNIRVRAVIVGKGLTRDEARRKALKKSPGDFRGFTYDPKTGRATLV